MINSEATVVICGSVSPNQATGDDQLFFKINRRVFYIVAATTVGH